MLAIRMQRTGRKGHAQFRVVVQDSRRTPTSGRFVAQLGHYDPHTKVAVLEKDKAAEYMKNGAQPSDRVASLFKKEGVKLPDWVRTPETKERKTRHSEKLRKNRPAEPVAEAPAEEAPADVETTTESTESAEPTSEEAPSEAA